jgi:large subunit ribosomal protein L21
MYAVIASGGKQYRVSEGDTLRLEKLDLDAGASVDFSEVLLIADGDNIMIGGPKLTGAKVSAEVVANGRGEKIKIIKFRRRKHHLKRMGHRQDYTEVKITGISAEGKAAAKKKATKAEAASDKE